MKFLKPPTPRADGISCGRWPVSQKLYLLKTPKDRERLEIFASPPYADLAGPSSFASDRVIVSTAPLLPAATAAPPGARVLMTELMFTTLPLGFGKRGRAALVVSSRSSTLMSNRRAYSSAVTRPRGGKTVYADRRRLNPSSRRPDLRASGLSRFRAYRSRWMSLAFESPLLSRFVEIECLKNVGWNSARHVRVNAEPWRLACRESIARQRRNHDFERIRCVPAMGRGNWLADR